jgi:serine O-acetyltransferase
VSATSAAQGHGAAAGRRRLNHPPFFATVLLDARAANARRGHPPVAAGAAGGAWLAIRLAGGSDAFAAQILYRAKARLQSFRIPLLPGLLQRLAVILAQVSIGDEVLVRPGLYLPHGQVSISGRVELHSLVTISPFVSITPREGERHAATIGARASVGTGAVIIGPVTVGDRAQVGANAVVTEDIPAGMTAVGNPARLAGADPAADAR